LSSVVGDPQGRDVISLVYHCISKHQRESWTQETVSKKLPNDWRNKSIFHVTNTQDNEQYYSDSELKERMQFADQMTGNHSN
jgi:hypothetical protein